MSGRQPDLHEGYVLIEQAVRLASEEGDARKARQVIQQAMKHFQMLGDEVGVAHVVHFQGRIEHELGNLDQAMELYEKALALADTNDCQSVIARAKHERARIYAHRHDFVQAEDGFRYSLNYYASQADEPNLQATLNVMSTLAENALVSPEFFLPALESTGVPYGTPEDYLYVRAIAIMAEIRDDGRYFRQRLVQKAIAIHVHDRRFAYTILDEIFRIASLKKDTLILQIARLLDDIWSSPPVHASSTKKTLRGLHRKATRFNCPGDAARSIEELYDYLAEEDAAGSYVYRGQNREYDKPLLPSMYRNLLGSDAKCLTPADPLYQYSLRQCGQKFYGEYNVKFIEWLTHAFDGVAQSEREYVESVYRRTLQDPLIVRRQIAALEDDRRSISWDQALGEALSEDEIAVYERYRAKWKPYLDSYHRRAIRMFGFFKPFGYLLGTTLAQQYGLSSAGLDATRSPTVAAFFATHRSDADYAGIEREGIGIIYRFPYTPTNIRDHPLTKYTYYTLPSIIALEDVLYRFERPGLQRQFACDFFDCYYGAIHLDGLADVERLVMPAGSLALSRITQQQAVIILPDELRKDLTDVEPGVDGITLPKFQYIDDIAARDGVERFYFHHTGMIPTSMAVTREQLWPRDDPFLEIIVRIMTALYPVMAFKGHVIPQRLDLLDAGYNSKEFLHLCESLANRDPLLLVNYRELYAMSLGKWVV
jgi:tetratricopeptide (TPR) repeat protein